MQQDPVGYVNGPSLYGYEMGNPQAGIDPEGLWWDKVWKKLLASADKWAHKELDSAVAKVAENVANQAKAAAVSSGAPDSDDPQVYEKLRDELTLNIKASSLYDSISDTIHDVFSPTISSSKSSKGHIISGAPKPYEPPTTMDQISDFFKGLDISASGSPSSVNGTLTLKGNVDVGKTFLDDGWSAFIGANFDYQISDSTRLYPGLKIEFERECPTWQWKINASVQEGEKGWSGELHAGLQWYPY
jgi:hypothetical protein